MRTNDIEIQLSGINPMNDVNASDVIHEKHDDINDGNRTLTPEENADMLAKLRDAQIKLDAANKEAYKASVEERGKSDFFPKKLLRARRAVNARLQDCRKTFKAKEELDKGVLDLQKTFPVSKDLTFQAEQLLSVPNWRSKFSSAISYHFTLGDLKYYKDGEERTQAHNMQEDMVLKAGYYNSRDKKLVLAPVIFATLVALLGSILTFVANSNGSLRITTSNCDMKFYAVGAHFPAATRGVYGESDVSLATEWYLQPWNLRPYQGLCPEAQHKRLTAYSWGEFAVNTANKEVNTDEEKELKWYQCIRRTNNPADDAVFGTMDAVNLQTSGIVTNFLGSWESYTSFHNIARITAIIVGCLAFMLPVPFMWATLATDAIDNIFTIGETVYGSLMGAGAYALIVFAFPIYFLGKMVDILSKSDFLYGNRANFPAWQAFFPGCDVAVEYMDGANCAQAAYICFLLGITTILITTVWLLYNVSARRLYLTTIILENLTEENREPSWERAAQRSAEDYINYQYDHRFTKMKDVRELRVALAELDPVYAVKLQHGQYEPVCDGEIGIG